MTLAQLGPLIDRLDVPSLVIDEVSWSIESLTGLPLRPVLEAAIGKLGTTTKILIVVPSTCAPELQCRFQRIVHAA